MKVGDKVVFVDEHSREHNALVTAVHDGGDAETYPTPAVNLLYVSGDETKTDPYGRQVERASSVSHDNPGATAHGRYWRT